MKPMTRLFKLFVIVTVLALGLVAFATGSPNSGAPSSAQMADEAQENASASLDSGQAELQALPNRLTMVYRQPGSTEDVVAVYTASRQPLKIVGRDESGAYLAVALGHGQGWVAARELEITGDINGLPVVQAQAEPANSPVAVTAVLTKVYAGPDFSNEIDDILMPQEKLQVLGRSADSRWLSVRRSGDGADSTGWIPAGEARLSVELASLPVIPA